MRAPDGHDGGEGGEGGDPPPADTTTTTDDGDSVDLGVAKEEGDEGGEGETDEAKDPPADETDEQKAEREAKETADAERAKFYGAPEGDAEYEITGLPEGTEIDKEALAAITPAARQLNLSNEGLSLFVGAYAEHIQPRLVQQVVDGIQGDVTTQRAEWEAEAREAIAGKVELTTKAGKKIDFGGRPMKEVQQIAATALDRLAPPRLRELLKDSGLGVNPDMVAFCFNAGINIREDTDFEPSGGERQGATTREAKYYPTKT